MAKKKKQSFRFQFVSSVLSITLVLLLLGGVIFCVLTARQLSDYVRESIDFSIVLGDDMSKQEVKAFEQYLTKADFVKSVHYISKEQALQEQTEAMGTDPSEFLGFNPFSSSFEIKLKSQYANPDSIAWIEKSIMKRKHIMELNYPQELLKSVNSNLKKLGILLLLVAAVLTVISFALINNTIRLLIYSKRFTIYTMKLVGATWGFIRKPFLRKELRIGACAGLLADGIIALLVLVLLKHEPNLAGLLNKGNLITVGVLVPAFGIVISVLCGYLSMNKYLRMKADELYYI